MEQKARQEIMEGLMEYEEQRYHINIERAKQKLSIAVQREMEKFKGSGIVTYHACRDCSSNVCSLSYDTPFCLDSEFRLVIGNLEELKFRLVEPD